MKITDARPGVRVRVDNLDWKGGGVDPITPIGYTYLKARTLGAVGTLETVVNRTLGQVWWVKHDGGEIAAYSVHELTLLEDQRAPFKDLGSPLSKSILD